MVDSDQQLTLLQNYDPFGKVLARSGPGRSPFGYTGEQVDSTGLVYLRARYYSPEVGRFLTADTIVPNPLSSLKYKKRFVDCFPKQEEYFQIVVITKRTAPPLVSEHRF